ncbi:hypothetical protein M758_UG259600 [Ceratodon purpureus]|nr:hypothetical protein M758_UG259600 [Ceratodon purpureus]
MCTPSPCPNSPASPPARLQLPDIGIINPLQAPHLQQRRRIGVCAKMTASHTGMLVGSSSSSFIGETRICNHLAVVRNPLSPLGTFSMSSIRIACSASISISCSAS